MIRFKWCSAGLLFSWDPAPSGAGRDGLGNFAFDQGRKFVNRLMVKSTTVAALAMAAVWVFGSPAGASAQTCEQPPGGLICDQTGRLPRPIPLGVSGGNIDVGKLTTILSGSVP